MINRIERPLANDHPDGSFSVHLFLHRPKTQNLRIIGQYTHNLLGLKTLSFALLLSSTKIWIKGPQIGSDMPSALGLVYIWRSFWHTAAWWWKSLLIGWKWERGGSRFSVDDKLICFSSRQTSLNTQSAGSVQSVVDGAVVAEILWENTIGLWEEGSSFK